MDFTLAELAESTGGLVYGQSQTVVRGATNDSRDASSGALFVAIRAERDGHDFVGAAISAGAGGALTDRVVADENGDPYPQVVVEDTIGGLSDLGRAARRRLVGSVVGITGSVGKTSTKDLVASVCRTGKRTHASEKSFNNEIGVPLTLLAASPDTEVAVVEMGARGRGHIAHLCSIAQPTIAVVTLVAGVHTELFGSLEDVAVAKGELIEALPASGLAILNGDDARVAAMAGRTLAKVQTYGLGDAFDFGALDITLTAGLRPAFTLHTPTGSVPLRLGVAGEHQVSNALAAAAVGAAVGMDLDEIVRGLETASLSPWRMEISTAPSGLTIINDAYNANPTSVRAALVSLSAVVAERRVAVLGVMAELGVNADDQHREIAQFAQSIGVEVVAVGTAAYGCPTHDSPEDAAASLLGAGSETAVLIKGSRVAGLERVAQLLMEERT